MCVDYAFLHSAFESWEMGWDRYKVSITSLFKCLMLQLSVMGQFDGCSSVVGNWRG